MLADIVEKINLDIEKLDLSVRSVNCLKRAGINRVFDILKTSPADLIKVRCLGYKILKEVRNKMLELGFDKDFLIMASNICALTASRIAESSVVNIPFFLKVVLKMLGCGDDSLKEEAVAEEYGDFCGIIKGLSVDERLIQFTICYYYMDRKTEAVNMPETDEDDMEYFDLDERDCVINDEGFVEEAIIEVQPSALATLDKMAGLRRVKEMVKDISAHCVIAKMKQEAGGLEQVFIPNALFLGNPGTGKTTVARIIAQLYKEIGLLEQGHLVVTEQADLIGQYVGQTAPKVKEIFESALGGVLFIDEAYMLGNNCAYGAQAAATLTNLMTEHKGECCVILAGYEEPMNKMMRETNQGMRERFPFKLVFDDYKPKELMEIFMNKVENAKLKISSPGINIVLEAIDYMYKNRNEEFANGRAAENLFQEVVLQQERRLYTAREKGNSLTSGVLFSLTKADCQMAYSLILERADKPLKEKRLIGFTGLRENCGDI